MSHEWRGVNLVPGEDRFETGFGYQVVHDVSVMEPWHVEHFYFVAVGEFTDPDCGAWDFGSDFVTVE